MNTDDLDSQIAADLMADHATGEHRLGSEHDLRKRALNVTAGYFLAGSADPDASLTDISETAAACFLDRVSLDDLTPAQLERIARDDSIRGEPSQAITTQRRIR